MLGVEHSPPRNQVGAHGPGTPPLRKTVGMEFRQSVTLRASSLLYSRTAISTTKITKGRKAGKQSCNYWQCIILVFFVFLVVNNPG